MGRRLTITYFLDDLHDNLVDMMQQVKEFVTRKSYEYSPLPANAGGNRDEPESHSPHGDDVGAGANNHNRRRRCSLVAMLVLMTAVVVLAFYMGYSRSSSTTSPQRPCDTPEDGFQCRVDVSHSWGQYSPFYSVPSSLSSSGSPGLDAAVPQGCEVTFAQVLSRHGARDPTASKTVVYRDLIEALHQNVTSYGKHYRFINDYKYTLGADQLTAFGRQEMVNSGVHFYRRYQTLVAGTSTPPFVRASGQERVVESAEKWALGFHQAQLRDGDTGGTDDDGYPYDILVLPEGEGAGFNNTLSDDLCTAFETMPDPSEEPQAAWLERFATPIAERLERALPGSQLSPHDAKDLMELCPFETVASNPGGAGGGGSTLSPFCGLFSREEWRDYEWYQTLGKWYGYGNGHPLGATRGVGWVNELVARLQGKPVDDHTSTNSTLDGDRTTFPLDRTLYADFSHDNDMASIFAAMGFYNGTGELPSHRRQTPEETGGYLASWSVPFGSRMYVEKLKCQGEAEAHEEESGAKGEEEYVRVLVNDRVMSLQNCGMDDFGRCRLRRFVDSLSFARSGGHWDACFDE